MGWRVGAIRIVFGANILAEGAAGIYGLYEPLTASRFLFGGNAVPSDAMRMLAAVWLAFAILSGVGIARTVRFSVLLVVQLVYKGIWLAAVALPAALRFELDVLPGALTFFYTTWVVVLPAVIPWRYLLQSR
jgi:hypothetical protein